MPDAETEKPVRPSRLTVQAEHPIDGLLLSRRNVEMVIGLFLLFWLVGWTVGCVSLAGKFMEDPTLLFFLVPILPFGAGWIVGFCMLLNSFLQRDRHYRPTVQLQLEMSP